MKNIQCRVETRFGSGRNSSAATVLCAGAALALAWGGASAAQTTVEEVVITANKRPSDSLKTAGAISALDANVLQTRGVINIEDIQAYVPGLVVGKLTGHGQITIRGVGTTIAAGDAEQGVASYIDGVYMPRTGMTHLAFGDLQRMEVLRGPQGTLYGRNATGGAVNYITNPPTDHNEAGWKLGYGRFNDILAQGYVSGPVVGDKVQGRLFAMWHQNDGAVKNLTLNSRMGAISTATFKGDLRFQPSDKTTIDLTAFHIRDYGSYNVIEFIRKPSGTAASFPTGPETYDLRPFKERQDTPNIASRSTQGAIITASTKLNGFTLKSITGYLDHHRRELYDGDETAGKTAGGQPLIAAELYESSQSATEELSLSGDLWGRVHLVIGGYLGGEDWNHGQAAYLFGSATPSPIYNREKSRGHAVYADATVDLSDRLRLIGGVRESWDRKRGVTSNERPPLGDFAAQRINCKAISYGRPDQGAVGGAPYSLSWAHFTPRAGLQYDLAPGVMAYAMYQKGYKPGGVATTACGNFYKPETNTSYETGLKGRFLDGRMTLEAAAFYYDYRNLQVLQIPPGLPASQYVNAPKAKVLGAEAAVVLIPVEHLRLNAQISLLDAEYVEFSDRDSFARETARTNLKGNKLDRSPPVSASVGVEYTIPLNNSVVTEVTGRLEGYYSGAYYLRRFNKPFDRQSQYGLLNAFLTAKVKNQSVRVFVKNITNSVYVLGAFDSSVNGGIIGTYGEPRTWGIELSGKF
jgi:iron complex outermembrane receptor protein